MHDRELSSLLEFAVAQARRAGALTLEYFHGTTPVERKADRSPVTAADRGAEALLREAIVAAYPAHGILGEEFGEQPGREPGRWILDPLDGTQSFISGVPLFAVLVGFEWRGAMLAGVIHLPALDETVWAASGQGCWWNGRRARVSGVGELAAARVLTNSANLLEQHGRAAAYERLRRRAAVDRGSYDAYGYVLVATGRAEVVVDPVMNIWDNAALLPVVVEAGGSFTDWDGRATHASPHAVATNGALFAATMAALQGRSEEESR